MSWLGLTIGSLLVLVAGGLAAGLYKSIVHDQRKLGASRVKEDLASTEARNAQAAGQVLAEHRDPGDDARRMRDGSF